MNKTLRFSAPYLDELGKKQNFVFEYKVPYDSLEAIREDLTARLDAKYKAFTFTFKSREELYKGLERVAHFITIYR